MGLLMEVERQNIVAGFTRHDTCCSSCLEPWMKSNRCVSGPVCGRDPSEDVMVNEERRSGCEGSQRVSNMEHERAARWKLGRSCGSWGK